MPFKKTYGFMVLCCCMLFFGTVMPVKSATTVATIGNSITAGWPLSDLTKRYPNLLQTRLNSSYLTKAITNLPSPDSVYNSGVSSRTMLKKVTDNNSIWTQSVYKNLFTTVKPGIVTIMLGTNDSKPHSYWGESAKYLDHSVNKATVQYVADYKAMIDTLRNTISPSPKVIAVYPIKSFKCQDTNSYDINDSIMVTDIIPDINTVAAAKGVSIINARTPFLAYQSAYFVDGVHPNVTGHAMLADIFYEGIINYATTQPFKIRFLWYGTVADSIKSISADTLSKPMLSIYAAPDSINTRAGVIICPGDNYSSLTIDTEGRAVARWFAAKGINAFVLRYRCSPYRYPVQLRDLKRAIRIIRYYASAYGVDSNKIGVMGFSAGGHLASTLGTHFDAGSTTSLDSIEHMSSRPSFMVLAYPLITMTGSYTYAVARDSLLGASPSAALLDTLSNQNWVTAQTPKTFLVHGSADAVVPIQNSALFDSALTAKSVSHKYLVETGKAHGYALNGVWPDSCIAWLKGQGFITTTAIAAHAALAQPILASITFSTAKALHITFNNNAAHTVGIYSLSGKLMASSHLSTSKDYSWKPSARGVYVVRIQSNTTEMVKRVTCMF